jgi:hypothetical protein
MIDISGFGTGVTILALSSFPQGFKLSQFADDSDPLTFDETETSDFELLYDGSLFTFDQASAIKMQVSVIPGSDDDINLKILLQARKGSAKLIPLPDITSAYIGYGNGGSVLLSDGSIIKGPLADSITTQGRKKANTYTFVFGSFAGAQSAGQVVATLAQNVISFL